MCMCIMGCRERGVGTAEAYPEARAEGEDICQRKEGGKFLACSITFFIGQGQGVCTAGPFSSSPSSPFPLTTTTTPHHHHGQRNVRPLSPSNLHSTHLQPVENTTISLKYNQTPRKVTSRRRTGKSKLGFLSLE